MPSPTAITVTHPTAGAGGTPLSLALPETLLWGDEFGFQALLMTQTYGSTGVPSISVWEKKGGRPMTLRGDQSRAWCNRGELQTLRAWARQPGLVLTVSHKGIDYAGILDQTQGSAIEAEPLTELMEGGPARYVVRDASGAITLDVDVDYFDPKDTDPFVVTVRFLLPSST